MSDLVTQAEELRVEFYRRRLRLYQIAPEVGLHPARIGEYLNGKRPLTQPLADRIRAAIDRAAPR